MVINKIHREAIARFFWVVLTVVLTGEAAAAITPSQIPLYIGVTAAKPNIMLMVDNSISMGQNVTVGGETPLAPDAITGSYTCSSTYYYSAGASTAATATTVITMNVFSNRAKFCPLSGTCTSSNSNPFGNSSGGTPAKKCFNAAKYYNIAGLGIYTGSQLNKFFAKYNGFFDSTTLSSVTSTKTRLQVVKDASTTFVNTLKPASGDSPTVRLGLARFNTNNTTGGGELLTAVGDLDAARATTITTQIAGLDDNANTPLAETLLDIGRYFTSGAGTGPGYTGNLTLHPGPSPTTASVAATFNNHSILNSTGTTNLPSPILGACHKSAVIVLSDGLPSNDRDLWKDPYLRDYDGDCTKSDGTLNTPACTGTVINPGTGSSAASGYQFDMKNAYGYPGGNGGDPSKNAASGGGDSSDYLDDVAQALYEMDLRPNFAKTNGEKNNLATYTVGFADPAIDPSVAGVNPLFKDTATSGGGQFFYATNTTELVDALDNIAEDIASKVSSSSSVVANTARLDSGAAIYQGKFDSADWTGSLSIFSIGVSEDTNGNGVLDSGEDTNSDGILQGGALGTPLWNAAEHIPAFGSRNILTYNPTSAVGVTFACANLTAGQKTTLGIVDCSSSTDQGVWRLNYIRGDWSHEEINTVRTDADTIRSTTAADRVFRNRTHLSKDTPIVMVLPDPWLLGDIVNSNPVYVSAENYRYDSLPAADGGPLYQAFVTANASRRKMIYVGANDGMLHGFDANATGADAGKEILAYIPNAVYSGLNALSSPDYTHQYTVDGSPRAADAFFGGAWHTLLVSSTGAGGKAVFALDITNPSSFGGSDVLWEISDTNSPTPTDLTTDTTALRGFAKNLGFTLPQASIVKMYDGSWAAIVANGYGSTNNLAVLYILDVQTGDIIAAIDTKAGDATTPNGLSTPIAVDTNNDRIADSIYAGDLLGNMWKFDVSSSDSTQWKVAYGTAAAPAPLFVACANSSSCDTTRQPITSKPQAGGVGAAQATGVMVYFGTGKYFETIDNNVTSAQTQTFYGVWDNNAAVVKSSLQVQTITDELTVGEFNLRATTNNTVAYPTKKGWYMDLLKPSETTSDGERVVSFPLLRDGRIIFNTLIPNPPLGTDICGAGSDGTSWLMEMDALTGGRLSDTAVGAPWDITGDGMIDANDLMLIDGNATSSSGKQSEVGITGTPGVVSAGKLEYKYESGSKEGDIQVTTERGQEGSLGSRQSWRQLQ